MDITIGMKRERIRRLGEELIAAADAPYGDVEVILYGEHNARDKGEVVIAIGNEDMERADPRRRCAARGRGQMTRTATALRGNDDALDGTGT